MRIDYITNDRLGSMPSFRYRVTIPLSNMDAGDADIRFTEDLDLDADAYFFMKHRRQIEHHMAVAARDSGKRVIFDMCDNHFMTTNQDGVIRQHYENMCATATDITCPTDAMADEIKRHTGRDATVIEDPWEMPEMAPTPFSGRPGVMWYGFNTGVNKTALTMAKIRWPMELIGNVPERRVINGHTFIPYSEEAMLDGFRRNDIVVIPSLPDHRCRVKSHNRLLEALRGGLIPCAAPLPSYQKFADFAYLDWDINAAIERVLENPEAAIEKVRAGQEYIRDRYSPKEAGSQWKQFLFG